MITTNMNAASLIKKLIPSSLSSVARRTRSFLYHAIDRCSPYFLSRSYLGIKLYYINGTGIVERIRFGSPEKVYELNLCRELVSELEKTPNPIFFDIGANIGLISMYVATHSKAKIYSFEPGATQLALLHTNVVANKLSDRWHIYGKALSNANGVTDFYASIDEKHSGSDGIRDTGRTPSSSRSYKVETETLDSWCAKYNVYPHVIKIDVEGAEKFVIDGGMDTLKTHRPTIYLEISPINLKAYPYKAKDIVETLESLGYKITDLEGNACTKENVEELALKDDVFIARPNVI